MRVTGFSAFALVMALAAQAPVAAHDASSFVASARRTYNLNPDWRTMTGDPSGAARAGFDDGRWETVTLPNAFNEKEAFARDIKTLSTGIVWYRKRFTLPKGAHQRKALLEFEGVRQTAEIWVNGRSVALSENGAMAFGADITAAQGAAVMAAPGLEQAGHGRDCSPGASAREDCYKRARA